MLLAAMALAATVPCSGAVAVCDSGSPAALTLVDDGSVPTIVTDPKDSPAVLHAAQEVGGDLASVAGKQAHTDAHIAVIIGSLGHNAVIDRLVREKRIDVSAIRGRWEAYLQQVVDNPMPGISRALVIVGADRRGAVYGAYDLSRRAGVSPWVWWADVPVKVRKHLVVLPGARTDAPVVRYRGIFLNDENPALFGWAKAKFGGVNHRFYAHVFDLLLRLKGNYLWPAMWGKSLWEDDPESAVLAQKVGVVLGTSHHEPMMRAQEDWHRARGGAWDYTTNGARLREFWRKGIERNLGREVLVTVGMRGDGDKPMTQGTAIPLLEKIVHDQRKIIADVTQKPASDTPQVWALYKEVQDYYDKGMKVPDDITLLFSDDNWGNIRRLPEPDTKPRSGGYGVYYHFDYVGGPRNYKWLNVTQVGRVWQQMELAHARGANRIWIANVGDLKPMELPISFFLDLAWNPRAWGPDAGRAYLAHWAAQQFGPEHAAEIADILDRETRFTARRTPELTNASTWNVNTEWPQIIAAYDKLVADAERVKRDIPADAQDAYFELVLHPVLATANLNHLYYTVALNHQAAAQGRADTNALADAAKRYFERDALLAKQYDDTANGKWPHMMDQTHIGYTSWQEPPKNIMPRVDRITLPEAGALGVSVAGQALTAGQPATPLRIDRFGTLGRHITLFDKGRQPVAFTVRSSTPWLHVDTASGSISDVRTVTLQVDWQQAPKGRSSATLAIRSKTGDFTVPIMVENPAVPPVGSGFVEGDGRVAVNADSAETVNGATARWIKVAGLGRTGSAMAVWPQTAQLSAGNAPALNFPVMLEGSGNRFITLVAAPSLPTTKGGKIQALVSVDGAPGKLFDFSDPSDKAWASSVIAHARVESVQFPLSPGHHIIRVKPLSPELVLERLEVSGKAVSPLALDPPQSVRR
ncbi:glycosyl hydrolase 115 family protein [Stakelama sediminis]|uniref:Gylcosyl hydrolase 115 C-terminal domain-containing protein n=1 Tax=Stakelama sediminis TaxID=463200 RepID=A0A840YYR7_9SPHN|nr:glycosyl hydrolase 115 family protein [Stakelama sediminis]MBB5718679.1 hypothetical protein [Stakelama sediminis]